MSKALDKISNSIHKNISKNVHCREMRKSIILEGEVENWNEVIACGYAATNKGYKGVVNKVTVRGLEIPKIKEPLIKDSKLNGKKADVVIVGGGIIGSAIARELSKWNLSILLLEKESDVAVHASSRNDGMIHPGFAAKPGTKKSIYNIRGNELYTKVSKELGVPINRCGSNILFDSKVLKVIKPYLKSRAKKAGVNGFKVMKRDELLKVEPNLNKNILWGLHLPSAAVASPYKMTVAYAENAVMNGVEVSLNTIVKKMSLKENRIIKVETNRGDIYPRIVINAAGAFSDSIAEMGDDEFFTIHPRKGEIVFLDKKKGKLINSVVGKPNLGKSRGKTKGGGLVKTIDGNILVGPDAYEQPYKEDYSTNRKRIDELMKKHLELINGLAFQDVITYCAGIRAATYEEDFIIEKSEYTENLIHAAGIQSPGFASAPAIAEEIEKIAIKELKKEMNIIRKEYWNPVRKPIPHLANMNMEERALLIKERPDYGEIICRCEEISKGEIIDALKSPIPVYTVDGIKRRVRAGMGRCQGGFCLPSVMEIIHEECNLETENITKKGRNSNIVIRESK